VKGNTMAGITKDDAMALIKEAQESGDTESAHVIADDALTDFLRHLGHNDLVDEYHKIKKWFA
jgi:hypothetical protein